MRPCVSETVVLRVRLPLTPVMVSANVPVGVPVFVVTENDDDTLAGFGLKLPLAPLGSPVTLRVT